MAYNFKNALVNLNEEIRKSGGGGSDLPAIKLEVSQLKIDVSQLQVSMSAVKSSVSNVSAQVAQIQAMLESLNPSITPHKVGTWNGKDLYEVEIPISSVVSGGATTNYPHGLSNISEIIGIRGSFYLSDRAFSCNCNAGNDYYILTTADTTNVIYEAKWGSNEFDSALITLTYTVSSNQNKKGGKK